MTHYLDQAEAELKRVDHLIYVTLKYTRTVDVIKSIILRMISTFDFCILTLLEKAKEEKLVDTIPKSPGLRANMLKDIYKNEPDVLDFLDFYLLLRELSRADFERSNEYRRHVTMTALLPTGPVEVNIDIIGEYHMRCRVFIKLTKSIMKPDNNETIPDQLEHVMAEIEFERR